MKCNWSAFADFLYPREGTETVTADVAVKVDEDFLYPREGTETSISLCLSISAMDFLYPREGTETAALWRARDLV